MLFDTNMKVSLEDYKIREEAKSGFDIAVSIRLKQYRDYGTKNVSITVTPQKTTATIHKRTESSPAPKTVAKNYKVSKNDTLWIIAKKFYGNGSQYPKIATANKGKIKNANVIYEGQVLTIPV